MNESWFLSFKLNTDPVMNYLDSRLGYKTNSDLPVPGRYGHHWTARDCYTVASYVALPCCRSLNMRSSCPKHSTPHQLKWTKASQNYYQVEKQPRGNNKPNWTNLLRGLTSITNDLILQRMSHSWSNKEQLATDWWKRQYDRNAKERFSLKL